MSTSRTPSVELRRILRKEVNFGCPICRSPFLTWHHFDPPWVEGKSHHEKGIIALCSNCHRQADGGAYTKQQLHELKSKKISDPPLGSLPWHVSSALINFGKTFFIAKSSKVFSIRIAHQEVFSLRLGNDGHLRINACIWNSKNDLVFRVEENDIISYLDNIGDLECTAQAKILSVISKENDALISLRFKRNNPNEVIAHLPKLNPLDQSQWKSAINPLIDTDGLVPSIEMVIRIHGPRFLIDTSGKDLILDMSGFGYDRATLANKFIGEFAFKVRINNNEIIHFGSE